MRVWSGDNSVDNFVNLLKLCVGAERVEDLTDWQATPRAKGPDGLPRHVTRMWPKREDGAAERRLALLGVQGRDPGPPAHPAARRGDGRRRHPALRLVLDPEVIRTEAAPRRPFQGWRYLDPKDAPRDLRQGRSAGRRACRRASRPRWPRSACAGSFILLQIRIERLSRCGRDVDQLRPVEGFPVGDAVREVASPTIRTARRAFHFTAAMTAYPGRLRAGARAGCWHV